MSRERSMSPPQADLAQLVLAVLSTHSTKANNRPTHRESCRKCEVLRRWDIAEVRAWAEGSA